MSPRRRSSPDQPRSDRNGMSAALEDYLEIILALEPDDGDGVRITDIAEKLGVRPPPVTRAVQALLRLGYVSHEPRRTVRLTDTGREMAAALHHRHRDIYRFLTRVLGVQSDVAEADTCQIEHGLSAETAQRLHEFLEHVDSLDDTTRRRMRPVKRKEAFGNLPQGLTSGWRA